MAVTRARLAATLAFAIAAGTARPAAADVTQWNWAGALDLGSRWTSNVEDWQDDTNLHQVAATIDLRGLAGPWFVGLAAGMDLELGFEVPGAFVYGFHLSPLGLGVRAGKRSYLGVIAGVGFGGSVDRLPFAWELPVRAFLEVDLGRWVRVLAGARVTFTPGNDTRGAGSATLDRADEVELSFGIAVGKRHHDHRAYWSDGTYVGLFAREQLGARLVGITLALSLNGAAD